ncbi:hypothetical protein QBC35DRAFT_133211 [Podospora australis]|uniref:Uncharacterized protein n=1 Tax=Podospora australis TaxID=1536484 RepID=A0AAN6WYI8_9PEZI|nr:hypothetical protein QBC35DRAFT_133211 [Podospora australis]
MASQYAEELQTVLVFMAENGVEFDRGSNPEAIIREAIRRNNGNVDQVVLDMVLQGAGEVSDCPASLRLSLPRCRYDSSRSDELNLRMQFQKQYSQSAPVWDDKVFDANRDNTAPSIHSTTGLSYNIQGPDEINHHPPYIFEPQPSYDPSSFAAPTRPPSRATSPSVNIFPLAADTPRSVPPPPPLPPQSGVVEMSHSLPPKPEFGPANRSSYDPNEWTMVTTSSSGGRPDDAEPTGRFRSAGIPGFLRCRQQFSSEKHCLGTLLMILNSIPAARNALISIPGPQLAMPAHDWWKANGNSITDGQTWIAELHRLMAFLDERTQRSYATADQFANVSMPDNDPEREFYYRFLDALNSNDQIDDSVLTTLISDVRVDLPSREGEAEFHCNDQFGLLDLRIERKAFPEPKSLYDILDSLFYPDIKLSNADDSAARLAYVTKPAKVLTMRINKETGMHEIDRIEIPEILYLDRYSDTRRDTIKKTWFETLELYKKQEDLKHRQQNVNKWKKPDGTIVERKAFADQQIQILQERITMVQNQGRWRAHKALSDPVLEVPRTDAYFGSFRPSPSLEPDEQRLVNDYEAKIRRYEALKAKVDRCLGADISPKMQQIKDKFAELGKILTEPSTDPRYNPTLPYTLVGVTGVTNVVFLRMMNTDQEKRWQRLSCEGPEYLVAKKEMTFSEMLDEIYGYAKGDSPCAPVLVYASEDALGEEKQPLPQKLKHFVKGDNAFLHRDAEEAAPRDRKRSGDSDLATDLENKLKKSKSTDSLGSSTKAEPDETDDYKIHNEDAEMSEVKELSQPTADVESLEKNSEGSGLNNNKRQRSGRISDETPPGTSDVLDKL